MDHEILMRYDDEGETTISLDGEDFAFLSNERHTEAGRSAAIVAVTDLAEMLNIPVRDSFPS
jgi:hypothetical protein